MHSRWHNPMGANPDDDDGYDFNKELQMSSKLLSKLTRQLTRIEDAAAQLKAEERKSLRMKQAASDLPKTWDDSVQKRQAKKQSNLEDLRNYSRDMTAQRYFELKKENEGRLRQKMCGEVDFSKAMSAGCLFNDAYQERERRKEMRKAADEHKKDLSKKNFKVVHADSESFRKKDEERKKKLRETNYALGQFHIEKMMAATDSKKNARRSQEDVHPRKESDRAKSVRQQQLDKSMEEIKNAFKEHMDERNIRLRKERDEDKLIETNKILEDSEERIKYMIRKKERERLEARLLQTQKAIQEHEDLDSLEAEIKMLYKGANDETKANVNSRIKEAARMDRIKMEIRDHQKQVLKNICSDQLEQKTRQNWDLLNHFDLESKKNRDGMKKLSLYDESEQFKRERLQRADKINNGRKKGAKYTSDTRDSLPFTDQDEACGWSIPASNASVPNYCQEMAKRYDRTNKDYVPELHYNEKPGRRLSHGAQLEPLAKRKQHKDYTF